MAKQPKSSGDGHAALRTKAGRKDTIEFTETVLHGKLRFDRGLIAKFEDPAAAAYFDIAFNGTRYSDKEPTRTLSNAEINFDEEAEGETIDPNTVIGVGREGVVPGATVLQVAKGEGIGGNAALNVADTNVSAKG